MKRKNSFLTFCFALIPGAGEMYMGLMKKGAVIMGVACVLFGLWGFLNLGIFSVFLPVLWFYSFFDTFGLRSMTDEQLQQAEYKFDRSVDAFLGKNWRGVFAKRHALIGGICIAFGVYILFHNFVTPILYQLDLPWLNSLIHRAPTLIVVALIILLGVYLISGGKCPVEEDYVEYGGDKHE